MIVAQFDANYGRKGKIALVNSRCLLCKEAKMVLLVDSSEEEYCPGRICLSCIEKAFKFYGECPDKD